MAKKLSDLVPEFREKVVTLIEACAARGVRMVPTYTLRTPAEQAVLWRQSRSIIEIRAAIADLRAKGAPYLAQVLEDVGPHSGSEVTKVLPGNSWHQWGEAVDCTWEVDGTFEDSDSRKVGGVNGYAVYAEEARKLGLEAGFYWPRFKDSYHVQLRGTANPITSGKTWVEIDRAMQERFGAAPALATTFAAVGAVAPIAASDAIQLSFESSSGWRVFETTDQPAAVFRTSLAIDADGSPHAYHPDSSRGLDALANAGRPGDWWALAKKDDGKLAVQGPGDPAPGYYVSTTTLKNAGFLNGNPLREIDAETVPYFVLPGGAFPQFTGKKPIRIGDLGVVYNRRTSVVVSAIFADVGPKGKLGEGSIKLAQDLGLNGDPRRGGTEARDLVFVVFPGSGTGWGMTPADIAAKTAPLFEAWGGLGRVSSYANL